MNHSSAGFNTEYFFNRNPVLSLLERERQVRLYGQFRDNKKIALVAPEGCIRVADDIGTYTALVVKDLTQHFDFVVGGSGGATISYLLPDAERGTGLLSYLAENQFLQLGNNDYVNVAKTGLGIALEGAEPVIKLFRRAKRQALRRGMWFFKVLRDTKAVFVASENDHMEEAFIRGSHMIDMGTLRRGLELHEAPPDVQQAFKPARYYVVTNAATMQKVVYKMGEDGAEVDRNGVAASCHLIGAAGPRPIWHKGIRAVDSVFGAGDLYSIAGELGATEIISSNSTPIDGDHGFSPATVQYFMAFLGLHNPNAKKIFEESLMASRALLQNMRETGHVITAGGKELPVTLIQPSDGDPVTNTVETNKDKIYQGLKNGFQRGLWVMHECGSPATEEQIARGHRILDQHFRAPPVPDLIGPMRNLMSTPVADKAGPLGALNR